MTLRSCSGSALKLALVTAFAALAALVTGCQSTCETSAECGADQFCALEDGACLTSRAIGFCKPRPEACTAVLQPICGCDGKTYDNSCEAAKRGSAVAGEGLCGAACGGATGTLCPEGQFCDLDVGICGQATPSGTCKAPKDACPEVLSPVCGCDGVTYDNGCKASAARVSVLAEGPCPCGGPSKIACNDGRFCQYPMGACLGPDPTGTCAPTPTSCAPAESPICGCDGITYSNACVAAAKGISVATEDPCGGETSGTGGMSGTGGGTSGTGGSGMGGNGGGAGGSGGSSQP